MKADQQKEGPSDLDYPSHRGRSHSTMETSHIDVHRGPVLVVSARRLTEKTTSMSMSRLRLRSRAKWTS